MDPNTCLFTILTHVAEGNLREAQQGVNDLACWIRGGGFEPNYRSAVHHLFDEIETLLEGEDDSE